MTKIFAILFFFLQSGLETYDLVRFSCKMSDLEEVCFLITINVVNNDNKNNKVNTKIGIAIIMTLLAESNKKRCEGFCRSGVTNGNLVFKGLAYCFRSERSHYNSRLGNI